MYCLFSWRSVPAGNACTRKAKHFVNEHHRSLSTSWAYVANTIIYSIWPFTFMAITVCFKSRKISCDCGRHLRLNIFHITQICNNLVFVCLSPVSFLCRVGAHSFAEVQYKQSLPRSCCMVKTFWQNTPGKTSENTFFCSNIAKQDVFIKITGWSGPQIFCFFCYCHRISYYNLKSIWSKYSKLQLTKYILS